MLGLEPGSAVALLLTSDCFLCLSLDLSFFIGQVETEPLFACFCTQCKPKESQHGKCVGCKHVLTGVNAIESGFYYGDTLAREMARQEFCHNYRPSYKS